MADLYDEIKHWSLGVINSAEPDRAELKHAMTRGDNTMFTSIASGIASPRKRLGMTLVNSTPFSNTSATAGPAIVAGHVYKYTSGGVRTVYTVVVQSNGDVHLVLDDGSSTNHTPTASHVGALSTGLVMADAVDLNNRLFLLDGKGGKTSLLGTAEVNWGVTPATIDGLAAGAAGDMTGDYDVVVTAWDATIGAESERSVESSFTLAATKMVVTVDAVAVGLTNMHFRVYLRKATLGSGLFRVLTGTGYVGGTTQGYPLYDAGATVSTTINISDATLAGLILTPPTVGTRGLPPTTAKYCAKYARRLFVGDDSNLYWSEVDLPDAFNPLSVEPISSPNGGNLVGLEVFAKKLQILTETGRHSILGGVDRNGWVIDIEDPEIGAVSRASIKVSNKQMWWWDKEKGPIVLDETGGYVMIGLERLRDDVRGNAINPLYSNLHFAAAHDGRVVFGMVEVGQTKVGRMLSYHTGMGAWESSRWDPMDVSSLFPATDTNGKSHLYLGNYNGQLFRFLEGSNDGIRAGTSSGTFMASAASINTITDAVAAFDVTGAGLIQRRLVLVDNTGQVVVSNRVYVTANTATQLTLSGNITSLTAGATYIYLLAGPDFWLETYWGNMGVPFLKKRFDRLYSEIRADDGVTSILMNIAFSWDPDNTLQTALSDASTQLWDEVDWDVAEWDDQTLLTRRTPIIRNGVNYKATLRNPYPDQGFTLLKLAVLARKLSDRLS